MIRSINLLIFDRVNRFKGISYQSVFMKFASNLELLQMRCFVSEPTRLKILIPRAKPSGAMLRTLKISVMQNL